MTRKKKGEEVVILGFLFCFVLGFLAMVLVLHSPGPYSSGFLHIYLFLQK